MGGRKAAPQPLALSDTTTPGDGRRTGETLQVVSPVDSRSPRSPRSPFGRFSHKKTSPAGKQPLHVADLVQQPPDGDEPLYYPPPPPASASAGASASTSAAHLPYDDPRQQQSPSQAHGHQRPTDDKASKSGFFFHFSKSSKSTERLNAHHQHTDSRGEQSLPRGVDRVPTSKHSTKHLESSYAEHSAQKPAPALPSKSDLSLASSAEYDANPNSSSKRPKSKPFGVLTRTKSIRDKDSTSPQEPAPFAVVEPDRVQPLAPLRTAPVSHADRSFREMMSSAVRNHSADRAQPRDMPGPRDIPRDGHREPSHSRPQQPSSLRENGGGTGFFSGLKSSRAADMISKGLFGKGSRSGSTTDRDSIVDDEHYVLKVINQPLVEQTRLTRISKRLEESRDKTEFWMPAFPWRAIDYLNYKGTDVEGLYRVPGSGPQIKKWQRKFDEEYDVDLFAQDDLYDINIIGSMLKAWLRELPDELFPKEAQERIARECIGADTVPQLLIDELSNLSPFNYYLLFAITCHLSLLLAHSDKNKMDFRNLCICFQPCMKIDAFTFKFLVCDWRDCWKGCKQEAQFIEEEYMLFDQPPPRSISTSRNKQPEPMLPQFPLQPLPPLHQQQPPPPPPPQQVLVQPPSREEGHEERERTVSSSDSSKQSNQSGEPPKSRLKKKNLAPENGSLASNNSTVSTTLTIDSSRDTPTRGSGDLRPLSPIKPLSPLGF